MINTAVIDQYLPLLIHGAWVSIQLALYSSLLGIMGGTVLAVAQTSTYRALRWFVAVYATVIRGTPMLVQIAFVFFLLPKIGIVTSSFTSALIAITLNSCAYISQIMKAGILSVSSGQREAGKVLGLSDYQITRYIILPQALQVVVPALTNEVITLIKDSSLASTIGVAELYREGKNIMNITYDVLTVYCAITVVYLIITVTLSTVFNHLEKRLNTHA